jgi:hypothetical protein
MKYNILPNREPLIWNLKTIDEEIFLDELT